MQHRQALQLVREIRTLYARQCELAERYNASVVAEYRVLREACRAKPQTLVPELEYFETIFDRQQAFQAAMSQPRCRRMATTGMWAVWLAIFWVNWQALAYGSMGLALIVTCVLGGSAVLLHQRLIMRSAAFRRSLRQQLIGRGVPICLECGYDLRGQVEPRCPECGTAAAHAANLPSRAAASMAS